MTEIGGDICDMLVDLHQSRDMQCLEEHKKNMDEFREKNRDSVIAAICCRTMGGGLDSL